MTAPTPKEVKLIAEKHDIKPEKFLAVMEEYAGYKKDVAANRQTRKLLDINMEQVEFKAELLADGQPCTAGEIDYLKALIENGFVEDGFMLHIPESETHLRDDWEGEELA